MRLKAFGCYMNACSHAISPVVTMDAIELISLDFPDLNIKKSDYGYDEVTRKRVACQLTEAML